MAGRARLALGGAAATVVLLGLVWGISLHVGVFERFDQSVFAGFYTLQGHPHVAPVATFVAHLCNPFPYVLLAAAPLVVAAVRQRRRTVVAVAGVLLGANLTTEVLKPLLAAPRAHALLGSEVVGAGSWPSGHATAAMSLAFCAVLAVPARWRPAVASAGAVFAVAVSYSFLALGWHYPSDVLGGYLVATAWTLAAAAWLLGGEHRAAAPARSTSVAASVAPGVAVLGGIGAVAAGVAVLRPRTILAYLSGHAAFTLGAAAIGVLAVGLGGLITLLVRR